jgi:hypothetical protein
MPPELAALLDKPWLLAIVLAVGAVCAMAVERIGVKISRAQRRAYWERPRGKQAGFRREFESVPLKGTTERGALDAADQLRKVMEAQFASRALLNRPEALFKALDTAVIARNPGW